MKITNIILAAVLFCTHTMVMAREWVVCNSCPNKSLPAVIKSARAGDKVVVKKGTYYVSNLLIDKAIELVGEGYPVLDAQQQDEGIVVSAHGVKIRGLQIDNIKYGDMKDYAAIKVFKANNVVIESNRFVKAFFGIYLSNSHWALIRNNELDGGSENVSQSGNGIHLWQCNGVNIYGNKIRGHRDGIYFEFARFCRIENNISEHNYRYGLHFMFSDNDYYSGNTFRKNGTGVAVMYSKGIRMVRNTFEDNWGSSSYGMLLKDISDGFIFNNRFSNNTTGIYFEGSSRISVTFNTFSKNGYAMKLLANCVNDTFHYNNFVANSFDVSTNGTEFQNHFLHNYWDKYEGYNLNKDRYGDVPYRPVSLYSVIMEQMPYAVMLFRSFAVELLERAERNIPSLTPEQIKDEQPLMNRLK